MKTNYMLVQKKSTFKLFYYGGIPKPQHSQ